MQVVFLFVYAFISIACLFCNKMKGQTGDLMVSVFLFTNQYWVMAFKFRGICYVMYNCSNCQHDFLEYVRFIYFTCVCIYTYTHTYIYIYVYIYIYIYIYKGKNIMKKKQARLRLLTVLGTGIATITYPRDQFL